MKEATLKVDKIKLSSIYPQKNIPNRDRHKTEMSKEYLDLYASIKNTPGGLIHFITVREDHNGKYELFAGYRRVLVYQNLRNSGEKGYGTILASIWPPETTDGEMLLKTIAENKVRSNLSRLESLEAQIAMVPFFLGCGLKDLSAKNKERGYIILKLYNSYLRSDTNGDEKIALIKKMTGCSSPRNKLNEFFDGIGDTPRNFFSKASVLMNASPEVLELLHQNKISFRHATALRAMKSDADRLNFIERLQQENISYKELDELIRESNIKNNPLKWRDRLVKYTENISVIMKSKKKDLTETEYEKIKTHLSEVEETILGKR